MLAGGAFSGPGKETTTASPGRAARGPTSQHRARRKTGISAALWGCRSPPLLFVLQSAAGGGCRMDSSADLRLPQWFCFPAPPVTGPDVGFTGSAITPCTGSGSPGSPGLAVSLVTPEHVPDEGHRCQRSAGSDAHGHRHLSVTGKGRHARAVTCTGMRVRYCLAPAGKPVRHLQKNRADDRERHHAAQHVLGDVPGWSMEPAQAADRIQVSGQPSELPALPASRPAL